METNTLLRIARTILQMDKTLSKSPVKQWNDQLLQGILKEKIVKLNVCIKDKREEAGLKNTGTFIPFLCTVLISI